ncbi:MAG: hypothetical protein WCV72_03585 [Patescibacteria group bacterium]|jgi:polyhydroxyalkanoate synthesis regulator protein
MGGADKAKGRGRGCDFSEVVDSFAAQTKRLMEDVRKAVSAKTKNGEIVRLTQTIREQINATTSTIDIFKQMGRPDAEQAIKSFESMVDALKDARENLPPVKVSFKAK